MKRLSRIVLALAACVALLLAACGGSDGGADVSDVAASVDDSAGGDSPTGDADNATEASSDSEASGDQVGASDDSAGDEVLADAGLPTVVVTTNILGDVVEELVGGHVEVVAVMPIGADPHDFQPSAQQVAQIGEAAALIVNGGAFEEGLLDVIESAEGDGVPVHEALSAVETIAYGDEDHDDHGDDDHGDDGHDDHGDKDHDDHGDDDHGDEVHGDDDHGDEVHGDDDHGDEDHGDHDDEDHDDHGDEDHDDHGDDGHDDHGHHHHDGDDPHFFTDPVRMAAAAEGIVDFLAVTLDGVDVDAMRADAEGYIDQLVTLDESVAQALSVLDEDERVLVTNHDVFGYFAQRYDFEVVGTVIPSGSTLDGTSARELADLVETIEGFGVRAIFADTSSTDELIATLAAEVDDVAVVELFSESLGGPETDGSTYLDMVRTNAERIATALDG